MAQDDVDDLAELRREIDRIDSALLSLVVERRGVSERIGARKGDGGRALRPGREAAVLRRLVDEAAGGVPTEALVRVWREIFALSIRAQGPFAVEVCAPTGARAPTASSIRPTMRTSSPSTRGENDSPARRMYGASRSCQAVRAPDGPLTRDRSPGPSHPRLAPAHRPVHG